jgi:dihydrofolate synthase/folylpolyglutamate synthase
LRWTDEQLAEALGGLQLTGRCQRLRSGGRQYLLDVAHNPAAVNKLLETINATACNGRIIALFSVMRDKDVAAMIEPLLGYVDAWCLADQPGNARAMPAVAVADLLRDRGQGMISVSRNLRQGFARARQLAGEDDLVVVFGSFFTVAAALQALDETRGQGEPGAT